MISVTCDGCKRVGNRQEIPPFRLEAYMKSVPVLTVEADYCEQCADALAHLIKAFNFQKDAK